MLVGRDLWQPSCSEQGNLNVSEAVAPYYVTWCYCEEYDCVSFVTAFRAAISCQITPLPPCYLALSLLRYLSNSKNNAVKYCNPVFVPVKRDTLFFFSGMKKIFSLHLSCSRVYHQDSIHLKPFQKQKIILPMLPWQTFLIPLKHQAALS